MNKSSKREGAGRCYKRTMRTQRQVASPYSQLNWERKQYTWVAERQRRREIEIILNLLGKDVVGLLVERSVVSAAIWCRRIMMMTTVKEAESRDER